MTNEEAKRILQAYRPSGRDGGDPFFAEALAQMRRDPELAAWFENQQKYAAAIAAKFRQFEPPAGLRQKILDESAKLAVHHAKSWWRQPGYLAVAASIALLASVADWWCFAPVTGATLDEFAVNFVVRRFLLQKRGPDVAELKSWLVQQSGPLPRELPAGFASLHALGCRTLIYEGRKISLICFKHDGKEFHVFVARRDDLPIRNVPRDRMLTERRKHAVVSWSDAENQYVLVSDADLSVVRHLLGFG